MGVKSLWNLLEPVGRPVLLETMEGKAMAIDSSIWIYQFQATMRDKEGRGLVNAHVLGFLRRISKLLFYGIKPVFVFDGGAPALKRSTIAERKNKKSGAAASHAKIAERLLAAQMRREAVNHAQAHLSKGSTSKSGVLRGPAVIDESTVYLEDLESNAPPRTPAKQTGAKPGESLGSSSKKSRWRDHDPYKLPDVDLDAAVARVTGGSAPDPRLATEEELRTFIEEMRPEDLDVTSPAFRELPTEVQYEIIGDLRLKSRQTSYKRLQNMLKNAKTPLDFSKEQIKNLKQRNALTQQLLVTTDSIGKAHVEIPIRIASERNKQYLLIKNEGEEGGWILGVRDEGSRSKPIEIDKEPVAVQQPDNEDSSDMDMEEVPIPTTSVDPDLRGYHRTQALTAISNRYTSKGLAPLRTGPPIRKKKNKPLFVPEADMVQEISEGELDADVSLALKASLESEEAENLRRAIEASKAEAARIRPSNNTGASSSKVTLDSTVLATPARATAYHHDTNIGDSGDDLYASPTRLETALSIANAGPKRSPVQATKSLPPSPVGGFGQPSLLLGTALPRADHVQPSQAISELGDDFEEVAIVPPPAALQPSPLPEDAPSTVSPKQSALPSDSDEDMEPIDIADTQGIRVHVDRSPSPQLTFPPVVTLSAQNQSLLQITTPGARIVRVVNEDDDDLLPVVPAPTTDQVASLDQHIEISDSESDGDAEWPRAASPTAGVDEGAPRVQKDTHDEDWDAAQEMDPQAEEGEFARFVSQVRGRDLEEVRKEIDDEIRALHEQRKVALRDSEDVTQQMVSQIMIMLRLFGIPYITAPMEAEAQCAELLSLDLVDGIITDDSDVFLFGGARILRNMFNQSKTVECFLLPDLERELGLDREKLVRLAYLLGSDYTEGVSGVGPVVAMELLTEFPGADGLHKFREWWRKVQSGRDTEQDTKSKFRKRFKKKFKDLFLAEDWPNPAVRDAYYHPTVDSSEESFKWGLPDLDALRGFFNSELGWNQAKVDDLLLPIIQKMNKRNQAGSANRQGNLGSFFDVPTGGGAPRKRQAYSSKRLQQVVADFRKQQQARSSSSAPAASGENSDDETEYNGEKGGRPKKRRKTNGKGKSARGSARSRGRSRGTRGRAKLQQGERDESADAASSSEEEALSRSRTMKSPSPSVDPAPSEPKPKPRPRPRRAISSRTETSEGGEVGTIT